VFGRGGELEAVLGLQGPAARLTAERRAEVLPALLEASRELSRALGVRGAPH
jgi:DNA-binding IclR family transcriptional regulator